MPRLLAVARKVATYSSCRDLCEVCVMVSRRRRERALTACLHLVVDRARSGLVVLYCTFAVSLRVANHPNLTNSASLHRSCPVPPRPSPPASQAPARAQGRSRTGGPSNQPTLSLGGRDSPASYSRTQRDVLFDGIDMVSPWPLKPSQDFVTCEARGRVRVGRGQGEGERLG